LRISAKQLANSAKMARQALSAENHGDSMRGRGNDEFGHRALLVIFELFRLEVAGVLLDGLLGQIQPIGSELLNALLAPALSDGPTSAALLDKLEFADRNA
jgi:hypothetical protein